MSLDTKAIRARADATPPGPWGWEINLAGQSVGLYSLRGMRDTVMDFVRWGMGRAAVRFNIGGLMVRCDSEKIATVIPGQEHHADWERALSHPVPQFIAHARTDVIALCDDNERQAQDLDCGCGVSGCRNMRRLCRQCAIEEADGLRQEVTRLRSKVASLRRKVEPAPSGGILRGQTEAEP